MKELSIEEKAKAYDELFVKAQQIYNKENDVLIIHTIEDLFPELKESEDEKIRKELIDFFQDWHKIKPSRLSVNVSDILAWLEKQKNCEYIRKDWLEHIKQSWYKEGFIDGKYTHKELTINDVTTLNELIDFLENGTAKLQHDLTLYANWLKTQFPPNEKQGKQKPTDNEMIEILRTEYEKGRYDVIEKTLKWLWDLSQEHEIMSYTDRHVLGSDELQKYYKNNIEE